MRRRVKTIIAGTCAGVVLLGAPLIGWAQFGRGGGRGGPVTYEANVPYDGRYTYARIRFAPPDLGFGFGGRQDVKWDHDYPRSDRHFPKIIEEITTVHTRSGASEIFTLDDPELMKFPVAYLCEAGFWRPSDAEVTGLRNYLLKGGFIIFDDFARNDWFNFESQMRRALPELRAMRLTPQDKVFDSFYHIQDLTYFHPYYGMPSEFWGYYENNDRSQRLLAVVNFNNDLSEHWEFSDEGFFPLEASNEAYKLGVNYLIHALTR